MIQNKKISKIDIIIPFKNKSNFRKRNLEFIIEYYHNNVLNSNIYVVEQDTNTNLTKFSYITHIKFSSSTTGFLRSKCLNLGVKNSNSKYLILADNDIIIRQTILNNILTYFDDFKLVIPYDKPLILFNNILTTEFINTNVIPLGGQRLNFKSYGGVQLICRESYYKIGGYDEQFVGWGHEDDAFLYKAEKLLGVKYINNEVYHLYHEYGEPILTKNERIRLVNNIKNMSDSELQNYINYNIHKYL